MRPAGRSSIPAITPWRGVSTRSAARAAVACCPARAAISSPMRRSTWPACCAGDLLPPRSRDRRGKGDWTEPVDRALRRSCESGAPLANRSGRLARYVHPDGAARLVERYRRGEGDLRWEVWSLVTVDRWLERLVKGAMR